MSRYINTPIILSPPKNEKRGRLDFVGGGPALLPLVELAPSHPLLAVRSLVLCTLAVTPIDVGPAPILLGTPPLLIRSPNALLTPYNTTNA